MRLCNDGVHSGLECTVNSPVQRIGAPVSTGTERRPFDAVDANCFGVPIAAAAAKTSGGLQLPPSDESRIDSLPFSFFSFLIGCLLFSVCGRLQFLLFDSVFQVFRSRCLQRSSPSSFTPFKLTVQCSLDCTCSF